MADTPFSKRHGYRERAAITIREDAPTEVREALVMIALEEGLGPSALRDVVCQLLRKAPDPNNWTPYPNIFDEVQSLIAGCPWYRVYDIVEALYARLKQGHRRGLGGDDGSPESFEAKLNEFFEEKGVGWKLADGEIQFRGGEGFDQTLGKAMLAAEAAGRSTAKREIHEALRDLSRRPDPDRTGAIQHSLAALECVAREVSGDKRATLGEQVKLYRAKLNFPAPLDTVVEKVWGYSSGFGRHLEEGREPPSEEAELVVSLCAALVTFLCRVP